MIVVSCQAVDPPLHASLDRIAPLFYGICRACGTLSTGGMSAEEGKAYLLLPHCVMCSPRLPASIPSINHRFEAS
jgi:hypothetical protein